MKKRVYFTIVAIVLLGLYQMLVPSLPETILDSGGWLASAPSKDSVKHFFVRPLFFFAIGFQVLNLFVFFWRRKKATGMEELPVSKQSVGVNPNRFALFLAFVLLALAIYFMLALTLGMHFPLISEALLVNLAKRRILLSIVFFFIGMLISKVTMPAGRLVL